MFDFLQLFFLKRYVANIDMFQCVCISCSCGGRESFSSQVLCSHNRNTAEKSPFTHLPALSCHLSGCFAEVSKCEKEEVQCYFKT